MNLRELRIGNWYVNYANEERRWELEDFELCSTVCQVNELIKSPIPLTPEWLERFGYRKINDHQWLFPKNDSLRMWGFGWNVEQFSFNTKGEGWDEILTPSIKYVHQLQNLYFALCGTELELKEVSHSPKES